MTHGVNRLGRNLSGDLFVAVPISQYPLLALRHKITDDWAVLPCAQMMWGLFAPMGQIFQVWLRDALHRHLHTRTHIRRWYDQ